MTRSCDPRRAFLLSIQIAIKQGTASIFLRTKVHRPTSQVNTKACECTCTLLTLVFEFELCISRASTEPVCLCRPQIKVEAECF